ncbi:MAG: hypothetical protein Q8K58_10235 [Acidimicrobiales bacterium]|nr:hypothetical protein [Acidimicrobiales bacterium]
MIRLLSIIRIVGCLAGAVLCLFTAWVAWMVPLPPGSTGPDLASHVLHADLAVIEFRLLGVEHRLDGARALVELDPGLLGLGRGAAEVLACESPDPTEQASMAERIADADAATP